MKSIIRPPENGPWALLCPSRAIIWRPSWRMTGSTSSPDAPTPRSTMSGFTISMIRLRINGASLPRCRRRAAAARRPIIMGSSSITAANAGTPRRALPTMNSMPTTRRPTAGRRLPRRRPRADLERRFDAAINPAEMGGWMKTMAAEPNHVGSAHNKANAEMVLAQFQILGLGCAHRNLRGAVSDPDQRKPRACRHDAVQGDADRSADPGRRNLLAHQERAAGLCRLPGRRRRHRAAGLRQLRHAGRLQDARAPWRFGAGQDRDRALRRRLARLEAEARAGARRGRLHHLFRSARRRLCHGRRLSQRAGASRQRLPARLGRGHDALSGRSADAGNRRDGQRAAFEHRQCAVDPEDTGAADLRTATRSISSQASMVAWCRPRGAARFRSPITSAAARRAPIWR